VDALTSGGLIISGGATPGQMTWLEDPPPWLPPCLLLWGKKWIRVTWFEDILTSKWPGSFAVLAATLLIITSKSPSSLHY